MEAALAEAGDVVLVRRIDHYPTDVDTTRLLRAFAPETIFVSVESLEEAVRVARGVERQALGLQVVAVSRASDSAVLLAMMRAGVREFISPPFSTRGLREVLARIGEVSGRVPRPVSSTDLVCSFLPAKPGVGTSTIALNLSAALAERSEARGLLADFDLTSGLIGFMLKLQNAHSVMDAAENSHRLDENLWQQLVSAVGPLDVLPCGKMNPGSRIEASQVHDLLDFARQHYKVICVDLSGNLEKYSVDLMHNSKRVFLVCTPELPSLHLARAKLAYFRSIELENRVRILLNRVSKRSVIGVGEVEKLLGAPVEAAFPNDYNGVHRALGEGKFVRSSSELGRRFRSMAESILDLKPQGLGRRRRFVEYFSIGPDRYSFLPSGKKRAS